MMTRSRLTTYALIPNVYDKVVNVRITYQDCDVKITKIDIDKQDKHVILRQLSKIEQINTERERERERKAHNNNCIIQSYNTKNGGIYHHVKLGYKVGYIITKLGPLSFMV